MIPFCTTLLRKNMVRFAVIIIGISIWGIFEFAIKVS
jgi:hypothetical protein